MADPTSDRVADRVADRATDPVTGTELVLTVLVATRDRGTPLRATLESLLEPGNLALPGWEVLVVDNGSTDDTPEVCRKMERHPEAFRWLVEPRPGKSRALNRGLLEARGGIVAMIDDDVLCDPGFVAEILRLFRDPTVASAQGRVFIDWLGGRPPWVDDAAARLMSLRDYGDEPFEWTDNLSGCNMVVRREDALAVGGFSEEIGPGRVGISEDSEFSIRLARLGGRRVYAPTIAVHHQVPRERVTPGVFRKRYFGTGRSDAYYKPPSRSFVREALSVARNLVEVEFQAPILRLRGRPAEALRLQMDSRYRFGMLVQRALFGTGLSSRSLTRIPD
jgi:glycosyltransferase involved in cell wall biosynthesis